MGGLGKELGKEEEGDFMCERVWLFGNHGAESDGLGKVNILIL